MSAHGTADAAGTPPAPESSMPSMRELLAAGAAANAVCTPPDAGRAPLTPRNAAPVPPGEGKPGPQPEGAPEGRRDAA